MATTTRPATDSHSPRARGLGAPRGRHSTPDRQSALAEAIAERTRQEVTGKIGGTVVARNGQANASGDDPPHERSPPELGF